MKSTSILLALAIVVSATGASAADWGTLKGRLVVDGAVPEPTALVVNKDPEYCGQHTIVDETIVPGENGGLPNAFVYMYTKRGETVPIHPDLEEASETVVLDNKGCRFEPHALVVRTGQEFQVHSSDPIGHNTKLDLLNNVAFNQTITSDKPLSKKFEKSEPLPLPVVCSIHPWMKGFVLIRDNPYMAVTDEYGNFEIENVPAGPHEFIFWHESVGNLKNVALGSAGKTDRKGRAKLKVPAGGELDLGDVKLSPATLGL